MSALVEKLENATEERQKAMEQLKLAQTHLQTKTQELEISEELRENAEEELETTEQKLKTTEDKLEIADNQFQNVKTELQITEKKVARLEDKIEYLENDKSGSSNWSSSTENIIISLIRRVNGTRETDTCLGSSLGSGYITAQSRVHNLIDLQMFPSEGTKNKTFYLRQTLSNTILTRLCFIQKFSID